MKTKKYKEPEKWVVINVPELLAGNKESIRIFGSIQAIADAKLLVNDKPLTYDMLRNRISDTRFWTSDKWVIKESPIIRCKMNKKPVKK